MSDYLTRLIERSLGLAPQIEPLIAPIHAPSGQMLNETVETSAPFESTPLAKIEISEHDASPGVAGIQPRQASTPTAVSPPTFPRAENEPRASSSRLPVPRPKLPTETNDSPHSTTSTPITVSRPTFQASRSKTLEKLSGSSKSRALSPTSPAASNGRSQIVVKPEIVRRMKPAPTPAISLLQPSPKEPPAIHVTIGRVEVRAVAPSVAAPKPAPQYAPKLSLEDYLKRRNGERS